MVRRTGLTLVELLVVVGVIAVLAVILLAVLEKSWDTGRQITCIGNLQKIGMALAIYRQDHDGYPDPTQGSPMGQLGATGKMPHPLTCPADPLADHDSYTRIYNYFGMAPGHMPVALTSRGEAKTVYQPFNGSQQYWRIDSLRNRDTPGDAFPGLLNPNCPPNTIAVVCPFHEAHTHKYTVLEISGAITHLVADPGNAANPTFWTLSEAK